MSIPVYFYEKSDSINKNKEEKNIRGWVEYNRREGEWEIHFNLFPTTKERIPGIIAHECLHLTNRVLASRGIYLSSNEIPINESYDEAHAYFLTWIINSIYIQMYKNRKLKHYTQFTIQS